MVDYNPSELNYSESISLVDFTLNVLDIELENCNVKTCTLHFCVVWA